MDIQITLNRLDCHRGRRFAEELDNVCLQRISVEAPFRGLAKKKGRKERKSKLIVLAACPEDFGFSVFQASVDL